MARKYTDAEREQARQALTSYNNAISPQERKKNCSKGGKKSAEVRKARKTLAEDLIALLSKDDMQERLVLALCKTALEGNPKAFETIRDTIGEKPREAVDLNAEIVVDIE